METGALVSEVVDDSPADDAGLTAGDKRIEFQGQSDIAVDGDVIVSVNGEKLTHTADLADLVSLLRAGREGRARRAARRRSSARSRSSSAIGPRRLTNG